MLKIALLQMQSHKFDQKKNLEKGDDFCHQARSSGADIALFPEMWNIGYTPWSPDVFNSDYQPDALDEVEKQHAWQHYAISQSSHFIQHFKHLAKELHMAIAITYLEKFMPQPRNTVSLINRFGEIVLTYAKVHTCDFSMEAAMTPGDEFYVIPLNTEEGDVMIGVMICFDREFPESARILMLKGAEIILTPNSCELEQHRIAQFKTRSYENMVGVALTNYASPQCNGHSIAFDGIAFDEGKSRDTLIVEAEESECIVIAEFDIKKLRVYRDKESWGNAYRKPKNYGLLIDEEVKSPFKRKYARR